MEPSDQIPHPHSSFSSFMMGIAVGAIATFLFSTPEGKQHRQEFLDYLEKYLKEKSQPSASIRPSLNSSHPLPPNF